MATTLDYITAFTPRGRWFLAKYVKAFGDTTTLKAHIYEVVNPGNVAELSPSELVVVNQKYVLTVGQGYAYVNFDLGVYAKWNDTFDEPTLLYSSIYAEAIDWLPDNGITWFGDGIALRVLDLDTTSIYDIAPDQEVIVPTRYAVHVGKRANTRYVFRAEDVVAVK